MGVVSLETVELWRPRRDRRQRARRGLATFLVFALLLGSLGAAIMLRRPLILLLGLAAALGLACALRWLPGGASSPPQWVALLPRRWVPRTPGDRLGPSQTERRAAGRGAAASSAAAPAPCNPQRARRTVAIGERRPV